MRLALSIGLALVSIVSAAATVAADAVPDDGAERVARFLEDTRTYTARFDQTLLDARGEIVEQSSGDLVIARPGRFRWAYEEPYEQLLVADGNNIWSYDVDLAQVTVKAQTEALANTPAMLLGGSTEVLEAFEYEGTFEDGGLEWVRLAPRARDSGFERMELGFLDDQLTRMILFDALEQTTVVTFEDVVVNGPVDATLFEFAVPEGADLVGTPAEPPA